MRVSDQIGGYGVRPDYQNRFVIASITRALRALNFK
jgi:hypothetical protein